MFIYPGSVILFWKCLADYPEKMIMLHSMNTPWSKSWDVMLSTRSRLHSTRWDSPSCFKIHSFNRYQEEKKPAYSSSWAVNLYLVTVQYTFDLWLWKYAIYVVYKIGLFDTQWFLTYIAGFISNIRQTISKIKLVLFQSTKWWSTQNLANSLSHIKIYLYSGVFKSLP